MDSFEVKVVGASKEDGTVSGCSHELDTVRRRRKRSKRRKRRSRRRRKGNGNLKPPGSKSRIQARQPLHNIYPNCKLYTPCKTL